MPVFECGNRHRFPHTRGGEPGFMVSAAVDGFRFPHTRGGEPLEEAQAFLAALVFPTPVGVNR